MPLADHFHPPLSRTHPWRAFHGTWAAAMVRLLNAGVLPSGYYATPFLDRDGPMEIDVAALHEFESSTAQSQADDPQPWAPSVPSQTLAVEWPPSDDVSVEVYADSGDPRLAAVVELVSPRNKDRPRARQAFVAKCAEHLRRGCGVVVVDVVATQRTDLHMELLSVLGAVSNGGSGALSAVSYRPTRRDNEGQLEIWLADLEIGQMLPTAPLWINVDPAVPLDLEASHSAACADLRIRQAG